MAQHTRVRIAICGGGITGLSLAVCLSKHHHLEVSLYEAAARFKEIGAGVMMWSRTWKILQQMGLASQLSPIANAPPDDKMGVGFDFRRSDCGVEGHRFFLYERPYGCIRFHRAEFLDVFVDNLPPGIAYFGKRLVEYSQSEQFAPISLLFADGSSAECDLLVGCDGIKSTIRRQLFTNLAQERNDPELLTYIDPIWTGSIVYRGLIPLDQLPVQPDGSPHRARTSPVMYCGKNRHIVCYTVSGGNVLNVVACYSEPEKHGQYHPEPWVTDCSLDEVLNTFADWESEVLETFKRIENPTRWAIHHLRPLPLFFAGNVVLAGDAAHATTPHQGAGAGQGIEDAYILSHLLGNVTLPSQLPFVLEAFQHVRLPLSNHIICGSFESGKMYQLISPYKDDYERLRPAIVKQWSWIDDTEPQDEADRALAHMQSLMQQSSM